MLYGEMGHGEHMHTSRDSTEDANHWLHCFDYIVQASGNLVTYLSLGTSLIGRTGHSLHNR